MKASPIQKNIPTEWKEKSLGSFLSIAKGKLPNKTYEVADSNSVPYLSIKYLDGNESRYAHKGDGVIADKNDLLVVADGSGSGRMYRGYHGLVSSTFLKISSQSPNDISNDYLEVLFSHLDFTKSRFRKGGAIPHFDFKQLKDVDILLPPIKEQKKIAEILGTVDEDIAKTQEVIGATEKLKRGLMQQLFTRGIGHTKFKETKIGQIPDEWELKKISNLGDVVTGNTPKTSERSNYGEDYLFVSPKDIGSTKYINDSENKLSKKGYDTTRKIPKGSVLVVCIGSTIGKIALAGIELSTNQQINSVVVNDHYSNEFIYYQLLYRRQDIIGRRSTQAIPIINKTDFSETYLALPKDKEEQKKISEILSAVDEKISVNKKLEEKLFLLKKGLMQDLLSGMVRVNL